MNKSLLVVVLILSAAVVLLSGTVYHLSQGKYHGQFNPGFAPDNRTSARIPCPPGQERTMPGNMMPMPDAGRQLKMAPPSGQPNFMTRPNMGGEQQGQRLPGGQGPGQPSGPGMGGQPGQGQQFGQQPEPNPNQAGSQEQISKIVHEAMQEAQAYFMSQNRKPENQEMLTKVQALMTQKMNAQGISQDIQQKVFSGFKAGPPQQPQ